MGQTFQLNPKLLRNLGILRGKSPKTLVSLCPTGKNAVVKTVRGFRVPSRVLSDESLKTNKLMLAKAKVDFESEVWSDMVSIYQPLIEKWIQRLDNVNKDVSDITQEVLCAVVEELPKFEHNGRTGAFRNWLRTITVNRLREYWRKQKKDLHNLGDSELALDQLGDPNSELASRWNQEHDRHLFEHLLKRISSEFSPLAMTAFDRFVLKNEDASQIASDLEVSTNQIYKYKFRIVRRLKEASKSLESLGLNVVVSQVPSAVENRPL